MQYRLTSFGRSFLVCVSRDNTSRRRCNAALAAAIKRYPNASVVVKRHRNSNGTRTTSTNVYVGGCCAIMFETQPSLKEI